MRVFRSQLLSQLPGFAQATATLSAQPLTFSGYARTSVIQARKRFLTAVSADLTTLTLGRQVHGSRIQIVECDTVGAGSTTPATYFPATDGLLTQRPEVTLGIFTADCMPVLIADPVTGWIGALHVGWKGAVKGIVPQALHILKGQGVDLKNVRVWCGPTICRDCYTVSNPQRLKSIRYALGAKAVQRLHGVAHVDLRAGVYGQLRKAGVLPKHIELSAACTKEMRSLPSARRDGPEHANTLTVIVRHAQPQDLRGRNVTVFGIGAQGGGEAALTYAVQQHAHVTAYDQKSRKHFAHVEKKFRGFPLVWKFGASAALSAIRAADMVIANPAVPQNALPLRTARAHGARVTNDIALFRQASSNPIIGVTGTKGKTTTATWLAHVYATAKQSVVLAGNVRHSPLLEPRAFDGRTPVILELSSFQLDGCDVPLQLTCGIVTNLFPDHLNRHGTMAAYARVKAKIFTGQTAQGITIIPLDGQWPTYAPSKSRGRSYHTSLQPHPRANVWVEHGWIMLRVTKAKVRVLQTRTLHLLDEGTIRSALHITLAARALGFSLPIIRKALRTFPGVPERNEVIRTFKQRTFIDNTTATNPEAAALGISSVQTQCICIAGGTDKALPLQPLIKALEKTKYVVLLPGSATQKILKHLTVPHTIARSMGEAVRLAWKKSAPGDTILLSPGAASFGLFANEFDRGAQFIAAARKLS